VLPGRQPLSSGGWFESGGLRLLVSAVLAQGTISVAEMGVPTLGPLLKDAFGLSTVGIGLLVAAINLGRVTGSLPSGHLVDRLGEAPAFLFGGLGVAAAMALAALAPVEGLLLGALFCLGVFASSATPAGARLVSRTVARHRAGLALGIRQAAVPGGALIAALILPSLALAHGVRPAMLIAAAFPVVGAVVAYAVTRAHRLPHESWEPGRSREALRSRPLRFAIAWAVFFISGQYAIVTYLVLGLNTEAGFSLRLGALMLTFCQVGGIVGRIGWGRASDLVPGGPRTVLMAITAIGCATALLVAVSDAFAPPVFVALVSFLVGATMIGWQGAWMNLIAEISPPRRIGTTIGTGLSFQGIGQVLWPPFLGAIAALSGSFTYLWLTLAAILATSLLFLWQLEPHGAAFGEGSLDAR
jgi:MFS family permease